MREDVYTRLREFMDTLPTGFPATPTGVELKILKKLFTPEEAKLTILLRSEPQTVPDIAYRVGITEADLAPKLEEMARKGLIFRIRRGDNALYPGLSVRNRYYEFQLMKIDKEFSELVEEYLPYIGMSLLPVKTRQMRVIPVESSVKTGLSVETYNRVRDLIKNQDVMAVQECICRKKQGLLDKECDRPKETCLSFGDFAQYFIDNGAARAINTEKAFKILDLAEESALVLSPANTQELSFICSCCSCCCPILRNAKMLPRPADLVLSYYQARIDPDLCSACGLCIERCQMGAIEEVEDHSKIIDGRCIGCGLCVSTCPEDAISMLPKEGMEAPPKNFPETLERIATERRAL